MIRMACLIFRSLPDSLKGVASVLGFKIGYAEMMEWGGWGHGDWHGNGDIKCTQPR
jgi:hypothetical protein